MFICGKCKKSQPSGCKPIKRVLETRDKVYTEEIKETERDGTVFTKIVTLGEGFETVKEIDLCGGCS